MKKQAQNNTLEYGRLVANEGGPEKGSVGGKQGAWVLVNWDLKCYLWLSRAGRLTCHGWIGSGRWGGDKKLGRVDGVTRVGGKGSGFCPRAGVIAKEAVEGVVFATRAGNNPEIPAMQRPGGSPVVRT